VDAHVEHGGGIVVIARLTGLEEIASWIASTNAHGATRIELWRKLRGSEQERVHAVAPGREPLDAADELLAIVERDRAVEQGTAAYALFAFRGDKASTPAERAFVQPVAKAVAVPVVASSSDGPHPMASMLATMEQMTHGVFGALQKENEHQRRTNEALARATSGHFDAFAKGYERSLEAMQSRLEKALAEASELRAENEGLREAASQFQQVVSEYEKLNLRELAEVEKDKARTRLMESTLSLLTPFAISTVTKTPLNGSPLGAEVLRRFVDSLSPAQIQTIEKCLTDPQRIAFTGLLKAMKTPPATSPKPASESEPAQAPAR
jgi:hypothetical protein